MLAQWASSFKCAVINVNEAELIIKHASVECTLKHGMEEGVPQNSVKTSRSRLWSKNESKGRHRVKG